MRRSTKPINVGLKSLETRAGAGLEYRPDDELAICVLVVDGHFDWCDYRKHLREMLRHGTKV